MEGIVSFSVLQQDFLFVWDLEGGGGVGGL